MPCNDGADVRYYYEEDLKKLKKVEAALCGVLTVLENVPDDWGINLTVDDILDVVDWKEAGIKRAWLEDWWEEHKKEDASRREREEQNRITQAKRAEALSKLTPEERKLLGIR